MKRTLLIAIASLVVPMIAHASVLENRTSEISDKVFLYYRINETPTLILARIKMADNIEITKELARYEIDCLEYWPRLMHDRTNFARAKGWVFDELVCLSAQKDGVPVFQLFTYDDTSLRYLVDIPAEGLFREVYAFHSVELPAEDNLWIHAGQVQLFDASLSADGHQLSLLYYSPRGLVVSPIVVDLQNPGSGYTHGDNLWNKRWFDTMRLVAVSPDRTKLVARDRKSGWVSIQYVDIQNECMDLVELDAGVPYSVDAVYFVNGTVCISTGNAMLFIDNCKLTSVYTNSWILPYSRLVLGRIAGSPEINILEITETEPGKLPDVSLHHVLD